MTFRLFSAMALLCLGTTLASAAPPPPRWSAGLGMVLSDSPYAGEGQRLRAFPLIGWEGERFYLRGPNLGVRLLEDESLQVGAALSVRLDGFDADDLGRRELAANGVDRDLLDDRSDGIDATLTLRWRGAPLELEAEARHDISGASEGSELRARLERPMQAGPWRWSPFLQLRWLSADLAGYYYGISQREALRGLPGYSPGSVLQPELGVALSRGFRSGWFVQGSVRYSRLPDDLADSPLLEDDAESSLFFALAKGF